MDPYFRINARNMMAFSKPLGIGHTFILKTIFADRIENR